jgi:hypothetical protein
MRRSRRRACSLRQKPRESRSKTIIMGVELKIEKIEGTRSLTERDSELLETSQM